MARKKILNQKVEIGNCYLNFPSKLTHPLDRQSVGMEHISTEESGRRRGRNDSVCAQIGVSNMAGTDGCTMDPPAAKE